VAVRNDAPAIAAREAGSMMALLANHKVLRGGDLSPEPEPPTLLG